MSKKERLKEGYSPLKKGYQPKDTDSSVPGDVSGGYQPGHKPATGSDKDYIPPPDKD